MTTIQIAENTYRWLEHRAWEKHSTPDVVANDILHDQLKPHFPGISIIERPGGPCAVISGTRMAVRDIVGYLNIGETPESIDEGFSFLSLRQIYAAIAYYHAHKAEIDEEVRLNNDVVYWQNKMREELGEEEYAKLTGQA